MAYGISDKMQKMFESISGGMNLFGFGKKSGGGDPETGGSPEDSTFSGLNRTDKKKVYEPDPNLIYNPQSTEDRQKANMAAREAGNRAVGTTPNEGSGEFNQNNRSTAGRRRV